MAAEGDAAGGAGGKGSNIVDFYLQKQQEHQPALVVTLTLHAKGKRITLHG